MIRQYCPALHIYTYCWTCCLDSDGITSGSTNSALPQTTLSYTAKVNEEVILNHSCLSTWALDIMTVNTFTLLMTHKSAWENPLFLHTPCLALQVRFGTTHVSYGLCQWQRMVWHRLKVMLTQYQLHQNSTSRTTNRISDYIWRSNVVLSTSQVCYSIWVSFLTC